MRSGVGRRAWERREAIAAVVLMGVYAATSLFVCFMFDLAFAVRHAMLYCCAVMSESDWATY